MVTMYIIAFSCFVVTIVGFIYLSYKGLINKKEALAGILASVLVQTATSMITNAVNSLVNNVYVALVFELISFALLSVVSLYVVFKVVIKDKPNKYSYSGYGFGFGISVEIMQVLPICLNSFTYYNAIKDNSIYDLLADSATTAEIDAFITSFNSIPGIFYISTALQAIALFLGFAYSFNAIKSNNKTHIIEGYVSLFLMCFVMFILPNLGTYNIYWACMIGYLLLVVFYCVGLWKDGLISIELKKK